MHGRGVMNPDAWDAFGEYKKTWDDAPAGSKETT